MKKSQKGFTIIEVALVLAIGALIFLVVFLAVPALQRNQRNDARKRDISSVVDAVASYMGNNPGKSVPKGTAYANGTTKDNSATSDLKNYLDTLSSNTDTVIVRGQTIGSPLSDDFGDSARPNTITVYNGSKCDGSDKLAAGSTRSVAVMGAVETAGGHQAYCQDAN